MGKWNFKQELGRKFVHLLSIFILLIYYLASDFFNPKLALFFITFILVVFIEFEYLRIETGNKIPLLNNLWKFVRRRKEKDKLGGDVFFLIGALIVLAVFDTRVASAAILMTTFGDMSAALVGQKFGKIKVKHLKDRAWEGIIAEFIIDILIGMLVFFWGRTFLISNPGVWILIGVMAITATVVETLIYKMDDNLLIPLFAGFNGHIVYFILRPY